jgi:hypothetical protein
MSEIANNPDTENRWPALRLPNLSVHTASILKEIEALKTKIMTYLPRLFFAVYYRSFRFARRFFDCRSLS